MKRFAMSLALLCVLSVSAFAGDVPTCGLQSSGNVPSTDSQSPGDVPSTDSASPGDMPAVDLSILLTVLDLVF